MDINIKNSALTNIQLPHYPDQRKKTPGQGARLALALGAAIVIIALGILLSQLLPRRREKANTIDQLSENGETVGGNHD